MEITTHKQNQYIINYLKATATSFSKKSPPTWHRYTHYSSRSERDKREIIWNRWQSGAMKLRDPTAPLHRRISTVRSKSRASWLRVILSQPSYGASSTGFSPPMARRRRLHFSGVCARPLLTQHRSFEKLLGIRRVIWSSGPSREALFALFLSSLWVTSGELNSLSLFVVFSLYPGIKWPSFVL